MKLEHEDINKNVKCNLLNHWLKETANSQQHTDLLQDVTW